MSVVSPWYSALETDVYHNNTECTKGNNIEKENIRYGTGERRLCDECENLANKDSKSKSNIWGFKR